MIWGIMSVLLAQRIFGIEQIGIITAVYPIVRGLGQLITGKLTDICCKKDLLFWGMLLQGIAIILIYFQAVSFTILLSRLSLE